MQKWWKCPCRACKMKGVKMGQIGVSSVGTVSKFGIQSLRVALQELLKHNFGEILIKSEKDVAEQAIPQFVNKVETMTLEELIEWIPEYTRILSARTRMAQKEKGFTISFDDPVGLDTYYYYLMLRRNRLGEKIGEGSFEITEKFREAQAKGVEQAQAD